MSDDKIVVGFLWMTFLFVIIGYPVATKILDYIFATDRVRLCTYAVMAVMYVIVVIKMVWSCL